MPLVEIGSGPVEGIRSFIRGVTDTELRMEYFDPGDGKSRLLFEGINKQGIATSANTWIIRKFTWSVAPIGADRVVTRIQVLTGIWDNRATLEWTP